MEESSEKNPLIYETCFAAEVELQIFGEQMSHSMNSPGRISYLYEKVKIDPYPYPYLKKPPKTKKNRHGGVASSPFVVGQQTMEALQSRDQYQETPLQGRGAQPWLHFGTTWEAIKNTRACT